MSNEWVSATRRVSTGLALVALASSLAGCVTAGTNIATGPQRSARSVQTSSVAVARRMAARHPVARHSIAQRSTTGSIEGVASYYWEGSRVASGGKYNPYGLTAAHRSLPFGTRVRVSDPKTQRSVIVTINDRGPFVHGRVLDLSLGAARALGIESRGVSRVHADVL
ncbi:MAG TPA: septal ring lytic transglycosylase RlpA family protein [Xanthobacteraceae bacterium]|jgi:rare lipoprotein A|nr:septal ring lytic transglycosylase RlpA family protein [Xanthobacteraceae bacterium]